MHIQDQMNRLKVVVTSKYFFPQGWIAAFRKLKLIMQFHVYVGEAPAHWEMVLQGIRQMRSSADEHQPVAREKAADTVPSKV